MTQKKILKLYEFIKAHKVLSFFLVGLIIIFPIFLIEGLYKFGDFLNNHAINTVLKPQDILSYFGVIVGSFVTFGALYVTIKSERNERKEDRRLQVYPYLRYGIDSTQNDYITKSHYKNSSSIISFVKEEVGSYKGYVVELKFCLTIENIGVNNLTNFSILKIKFLEETSTPKLLRHIKVNETEKHLILIEMTSQDESEKHNQFTQNEMVLTVAYCSIKGDYYEQNIKINFYKIFSKTTGVWLDTEARLKQINVSEPDFSDDKNIFEEIKNRE